MLRYVHAHDLGRFPRLADTMFRDRADQFATRLGWEVSVDARGHERDAYDDLNPLYVIWEGEDGQHQGSLRLLPTTGPTMIDDHFQHLLGGRRMNAPRVWECTRFCLSRGAASRVAAALMLGGGEMMTRLGVEHFAGVFDARMIRIYRAIGASPQVLGGKGEGRERISVGLWTFSAAARARVAERAGVPPALSDLWVRQSFGANETALARSA